MILFSGNEKELEKKRKRANQPSQVLTFQVFPRITLVVSIQLFFSLK